MLTSLPSPFKSHTLQRTFKHFKQITHSLSPLFPLRLALLVRSLHLLLPQQYTLVEGIKHAPMHTVHDLLNLLVAALW